MAADDTNELAVISAWRDAATRHAVDCEVAIFGLHQKLDDVRTREPDCIPTVLDAIAVAEAFYAPFEAEARAADSAYWRVLGDTPTAPVPLISTITSNGPNVDLSLVDVKRR